MKLPFKVAILTLLSAPAFAQGYPEKTVVMVAPFPAGGSVDLVARALAQNMSELWKQPVIVSNRPGASGRDQGRVASASA